MTQDHSEFDVKIMELVREADNMEEAISVCLGGVFAKAISDASASGRLGAMLKLPDLLHALAAGLIEITKDEDGNLQLKNVDPFDGLVVLDTEYPGGNSNVW
jgi:hypothetical protein